MKKELQLQIYDTETRAKEIIAPADGKTLKMYTCGPTIYDFAHIGNFRTYIFEDLLRRTIKYFGMDLFQVMNLTDVDDKTIKGAIKEGVSLQDYTKKYKDAFFEDLKTLLIEPVEAYPAATDHIDAMIQMISTLLDKGIAYKGQDGSVYFSIEHFPSYGRLSHLHLGDLKSGASNRVASDEYDKESLADFVLWKAYDAKRDGDIFWESPFGKGRPGWHIECSSMAIKLLGETIDIHVGGVDNIFPHHENEIAQSEACTGKHFTKRWVHSEHLLVDGRKMSKSLGNFYTLKDLLDKGYSGVEVRYLLLQTHYRTQLNFTLKGLDAARTSLTRLSDFIHRLRGIKSSGKPGSVDSLLEGVHMRFDEALADDLNISAALATLFDLLREVNRLADDDQLDPKGVEAVLAHLEKINQVIGVLPLKEQKLSMPSDIQEAFDSRELARKEKNWSKADEYRDYIHSAGYLIEDTPVGPRLKKK